MGLLMNEEVETQEAETQEVQAQETVEQEQPQEQVAERPDWLPEKFERPEELANSYKELERSFYKRKDEFREQIINELNDEVVEGVPTSPADYEVNIKAPEGMEFTVNEDDPLLNWFRDKAHDYGLNQEDFDGLVNEWATMDAMRGPDWNVESEALGEHAEKDWNVLTHGLVKIYQKMRIRYLLISLPLQEWFSYMKNLWNSMDNHSLTWFRIPSFKKEFLLTS